MAVDLQQRVHDEPAAARTRRARRRPFRTSAWPSATANSASATRAVEQRAVAVAEAVDRDRGVRGTSAGRDSRSRRRSPRTSAASKVLGGAPAAGDEVHGRGDREHDRDVARGLRTFHALQLLASVDQRLEARVGRPRPRAWRPCGAPRTWPPRTASPTPPGRRAPVRARERRLRLPRPRARPSAAR